MMCTSSTKSLTISLPPATEWKKLTEDDDLYTWRQVAEETDMEDSDDESQGDGAKKWTGSNARKRSGSIYCIIYVCVTVQQR